MAVVIRMKRSGRRNRPCYRISVAESRDPRDGRVLENLGLYDPVAPKVETQVTLNVERARHWLDHGALPSDTVASIFKREGVYEGREPKKARKRTGRGTATKTRARRLERTRVLEERKQARSAERKAARLAAKKAAKEAAAAEGEGEAES